MLCYYRDIRNQVFLKLLSDDWFFFPIFQIILRKAMLNLVNILTYKERKRKKRKSSEAVGCSGE